MRFYILILLSTSLAISLGCKEPEPVSQAQPADTGEVETERVVAEAGVGKQGQVIGDKEGFLRTPVKALFKVKQKAEFLKVEYALKLYEAAEGFKPKTEDEFFDKIITANQIKLPELPEGQTYVWDPELGELLVEKPKSE